MQIKQISDSVIELAGNNGKVLFLYPDAEDVKQVENEKLVGMGSQKNITSQPGEYEFSEVTVIALETKSATDGRADIFSVTVDGVNCLFMGTEKLNLKKDQQDLIGKVDLLFTNIAATGDIKGIINKVEPGAVVAFNFESPEAAAKETDLTAPESEEKKIKFSAAEFSEEDTSTVLYLLTK